MGYCSNNIEGRIEIGQDMIDLAVSKLNEVSKDIIKLESLSEDVMTVKQSKDLVNLKKNLENTFVKSNGYQIFLAKPKSEKDIDVFFYLNDDKKISLAMYRGYIDDVNNNKFRNISFETKFDIRSDLKMLTSKFNGYVNLYEDNTYEEDGYAELGFKNGKESNPIADNSKTHVSNKYYYLSTLKNSYEIDRVYSKAGGLDYTKEGLVGFREIGSDGGFKVGTLPDVFMFENLEDSKKFLEYINGDEEFSTSDFEKRKDIIIDNNLMSDKFIKDNEEPDIGI